MGSIWLNFLKLLGQKIHHAKADIVKADIGTSILLSLFIILLELVLALVSIPFYIKKTYTQDPSIFNNPGFSYRLYRLRRRATFVVSILVSFLILVSLLYSNLTKAVTITWDGGGVDNNWSTAENWSTDTVPTTTDDIVFDGSLGASSTKNVIFDSGVASGTISSIAIASGYTGTLSLERSMIVANNFSIDDGSFLSATQTLSIRGDFAQAAGSFIASTATTSFAGDFRQTGGTFTDAGGVVLFDSTSTDSIINLDTSISFTNLVLNLAGSVNNSFIFEDSSDTAILVSNSLTLIDGQLEVATGTTRIELSGDLDHRSTWNGGNGVVSISGSSRTVVLTGDSTLSHLEIDGSGIDVQASGTTSTFTGLTILDGTFTAGSTNIVVTATTTVSGTGAIYAGGVGTDTLTGLTLSTGTVQFGGSNASLSGSFFQYGGTLVASSVTTSFAIDFRSTGGYFDPNGGVTSLSDSSHTLVYIDTTSTFTLNDFAINKVGNKLVQFIDSNDRVYVSGTLYLYGGKLNGGNGRIVAQNGFVHESGFDGLVGNIEISGPPRVLSMAPNSTFPTLILNSTGTIFSLTGGGTTTIYSLALYAGTLNAGTSSLQTSVHFYVQGSEAVFDGGSGNLAVQQGFFALSGANVKTGSGYVNTGGSAIISNSTVDFSSSTVVNMTSVSAGAYVDIGGSTVTAPSTTWFIYGGVHPSIGTFRIGSGTTFSANSGTVRFAGSGNQMINTLNYPVSFYNLEKSVTSATSSLIIATSASTTVYGTLTLRGSSTSTIDLVSGTCTGGCGIATGTQAILNIFGPVDIADARIRDIDATGGNLVTVGSNVEDLGNVDGLIGLYDDTVPTAPGSLSLATLGQTSVGLAFGTTSTEVNFAGYEIYYTAATSGVTRAGILHSSSTDNNLGYINYNGATSTTVSGLSVNTQYVFNIWAVDEYTNSSSASSELALYTAVYEPASLSASFQGTDTTIISWSENGNNTTTEYYVEDANNSGTNSGWVSDTTSYSFQGLNNGINYTFQVKARNGGNVETSPVQLSFITRMNGGGGTTGAPAIPPSPPSPPPSSIQTEPTTTEENNTNTTTIEISAEDPPPRDDTIVAPVEEEPPAEETPTGEIPENILVEEPEFDSEVISDAEVPPTFQNEDTIPPEEFIDEEFVFATTTPFVGSTTTEILSVTNTIEKVVTTTKLEDKRVEEKKESIIEKIRAEEKFIPKVQVAIEQTIEKTVESIVEVAGKIDEVANDPEVEIVARRVVPQATAGISTVTLLASMSGDIAALLRLMFLQPLLLLGMRKRKGWGLVYNSMNKLPVDLAIVSLTDVNTNKRVESRVTDVEGRYMFRPKPGFYRLMVSKKGFVFPSHALKYVVTDGTKLDLYHGDTLEVGNDGNMVTPNIPLDPENAAHKVPKRIKRQKFFRKAQNFTALTGILATVISLYIAPTYMVLLFLTLHIVLFVVFKKFATKKKPKKYGRVKDKDTGVPVERAVVKLYTKQYNKVIDIVTTSSKGDYAFLVGPSEYFFTVEHPMYQTYTSRPIEFKDIEEAFIADDVEIISTQKINTFKKNTKEDLHLPSFKPDFGNK